MITLLQPICYSLGWVSLSFTVANFSELLFLVSKITVEGGSYCEVRDCNIEWKEINFLAAARYMGIMCKPCETRTMGVDKNIPVRTFNHRSKQGMKNAQVLSGKRIMKSRGPSQRKNSLDQTESLC